MRMVSHETETYDQYRHDSGTTEKMSLNYRRL